MPTKDSQKEIGKRIRRLRLAIGKTREDVMRETGCSRTATSYWESGKASLGADNVFKLAKCLGVSAHELWYGTPEFPNRQFIPEFERIRVQNQRMLKAKALEWLECVRHAINELEPAINVETSATEDNSAHPPETTSPKGRQGNKPRKR